MRYNLTSHTTQRAKTTVRPNANSGKVFYQTLTNVFYANVHFSPDWLMKKHTSSRNTGVLRSRKSLAKSTMTGSSVNSSNSWRVYTQPPPSMFSSQLWLAARGPPTKPTQPSIPQWLGRRRLAVRTFLDLRPIYGWQVVTLWANCPLFNQPGQLSLPSLWGR